MIAPSTSAASSRPPETSAISTATSPARNAPINGTNAAKNVITMIGTTSGTPMISSARPIRIASTRPTSAIPRT